MGVWAAPVATMHGPRCQAWLPRRVQGGRAARESCEWPPAAACQLTTALTPTTSPL